MFVIDTNVASELVKPAPAPSVAAWIAARDATELFLTAVSKEELLYGAAILPARHHGPVVNWYLEADK